MKQRFRQWARSKPSVDGRGYATRHGFAILGCYAFMLILPAVAASTILTIVLVTYVPIIIAATWSMLVVYYLSVQSISGEPFI